MAYQLVFRAPTGERTVTIDRAIVVGRDAGCDVPIDSVRVSRRHAEFSITSNGVVVRDLGSRNGTMVNGVRSEQAVIGPADRVLLGDVVVHVVTASATISAPDPPPNPYGAAPGAPPVPYPSAAVPQPVTAPAYTPPPMPPYAAPPASYAPASAPSMPASLAPGGWAPGPPGSSQAGDKTTVLPRGAAPPGAVAPGTATPKEPASKSLFARLSLGARITAGVVGAASFAFLVTAIPLSVAREQVATREALARAATIARSLGIENGPILATGQTLGTTVHSAAVEPGVREALILGPDGRVLAPNERMDQKHAMLGSFGAIESLQGMQTIDLGTEVQAVAVIESGGRRLGIAWITMDPGYGSAGAPFILYVAAALLASVGLGFGIAVLLRKMIAVRLATFATDVDLAASGQLDAVSESLGLPRLAESVNFVIARMRMMPQQVVQAAPAQVPASFLVDRPAPLRSREGQLTLDAAYGITAADGGAAQILGSGEDRLKGHHVLEAVSDQALVTAIIDAIGELGAGGTATRRTDGAGGQPALELVARRDTADGPIAITLRCLG